MLVSIIFLFTHFIFKRISKSFVQSKFSTLQSLYPYPTLALVSQDPPKAQLIFEPRGRPGEDRQYYLEEKENICVVCGSGNDCVRKNIVPHEYRQ